MKGYTCCPNCGLGYEEVLDTCPVCFFSNVNPENATVILDGMCRTEISKLGGCVAEFIIATNSEIVIPCEWGVVLFDRILGFRWELLVGLVRDVVLNQDNTIYVNAGPRKVLLDLKTGKVLKELGNGELK